MNPAIETWAAGIAARAGWHHDDDTQAGHMMAALRSLPDPAPMLHPANGNRGHCAYCLTLRRVGDAHAQEHHDARGGCIRLLWCWPCAEVDPLVEAIADAANLPPGDAGADAAFEQAHRDLHARVLRRCGTDGLRAVFHVGRDIPAPLTLRCGGARWALPTEVVA